MADGRAASEPPTEVAFATYSELSTSDSDSSLSSDSEVEHDSPTEVAFATYFFQWVGLLLMCAAAPIGEAMDLPSYAFLSAGAFLYLVHVVHSLFCSKAMGYLEHVMSEKDFVAYVKAVQEKSPKISWRITCWHYETRVETHTDAEGNSHTTTKQERVNTHIASMRYGINGFVDETLSAAQTTAMFHLLNDGTKDLNDLEEGAIQEPKGKRSLFLLCHFPIEFHPAASGDETHYNKSKRAFYSANTRDVYQEKHEDHSVDNYMERCMVVLTGDEDDTMGRPWWMSVEWFVLSVFCMASIPYRLHLFKQCQFAEWTILKHFSGERPHEEWEDPVPMNSRLKRKDTASAAFRALPRERQGSGGATSIRHTWGAAAADTANQEPIDLAVAVPSYWKTQDLSQDFDVKVRLNGAEVEDFQRLVDSTFMQKASRDRQDGKMPTRLKVTNVLRIEDKNLYMRYMGKRAELAAKPRPTLIRHMPGSGEVKTVEFSFAQDQSSYLTAPGLNEVYLFHGSSPGGAMGIGETGFDLSKVGQNVGTMFGAGAYMAEACSKSDEYAREDPSGVFAGKYALLLCRVLVGRAFYTTESDIPAIESALATGEYDAVLGDREAAVGTYREFVVFDEAQIYPEYAIVYERQFDA